MSTLSTSAGASCPGASSHSSGLIRKIVLLTLVLVFFPLLTPKVHSSQVTLAWDANTESHLAGYKVYYGEASRTYSHTVDVGNKTSYSLAQMPNYQETYFAVTAYDKYGQESRFSEEVVWKGEPPPTVYVITASAGNGGSISPSGQVEVVSGDDAAFSIKPDDGFAIQDVVVNGTSRGSVSSFTFLNVTSDQSISAYFSQIQVVEYGSLSATIEPAEAAAGGARWRVNGGDWKNSGDVLSSLPTGTYTVQFSSISGWDKPADQSVTVTKDNTATASGEYTQHTGAISASITPEDAIKAGARWSIDGKTWLSSGAILSDLPLSTYTVKFNSISGWDKPADQSVTVTKDSTANASGKYTQQTGALSVNITPEDAIKAGAQWRLDGGEWQNSGDVVSNLTTGTYTVQFRHISGWNHPADKTVSVTQGNTVNISGEYTPYAGEIENKTDILVIAPHPDDDLITAGGVIYSAVQTGKSVKVVYITNGDYRGIDMGYLRQGEAAAGQSWLGVDEDSLIFLGYPEGHLINLFVDNPDEFDMFTTDHGQDHTYGNRGLGRTDYHTHRWGSPAAYNKHNLIMDIQDVLQTYKPEYILTTSEYDRYSDHAVTYQLMKEAVVKVNNFDPQFNPTIYKTIVHWDGSWPEPIDRDAYYTEIPDLSETDLRWENRASIDIPYYAQTARVNAISEHRSQGGLSGPLGSYVHKDEIFWVEKLFGNQIPPVPNADFDQTVQEGEQVYLDGSKSFGNTPLTYQWSQTAGISVKLSDPYAASPGFTAPAGLNHDELLVFQLIVSDGVSASISDYVHVQVKAASPYENIAQLADVSASSENIDSEQSAEKAQDGIVDGWPGDHTREWATQGEGAGAWLCMEWPDYHVSDRVVVYDRPNEDDHILGAALAFNSGAEVIELDALDVIAGRTEFKFKPVKFKNMCFIVDKVSNRTQNTGLAEIEVFGVSSGTDDNSDTGQNSPEPASGNLSVTPGDFVFEGRSGGPFRPNRTTYTLTNTGEAEISWKVSNTKAWLRVSSESGILGPGQSVDIALSIFNRDTRSLSTGSHSDTVSFENLTDCNGNTTREITLIIN
jgi:LmbE family N-acetylglucosaminyl deacetylase